MVVPQDDNHSSGSSTCLPDDPYQEPQVQESQEHEADFSTVPPTPNVRSFLASPVRMSTGSDVCNHPAPKLGSKWKALRYLESLTTGAVANGSIVALCKSLQIFASMR